MKERTDFNKVAGYDDAVVEAIRQEEAAYRAMLRLQKAMNETFHQFKKLGRPRKVITNE